VGKSSIITRLIQNRFTHGGTSTCGADFWTWNCRLGDETARLQIWDTAGQEEFHSLAPIYYKDAHAALLVFSLIDQRSFDRMVQWKNELISSRGEDIKLVVVGNKADVVKDRCIKNEQGEAIAAANKAQYFEVSAKTGQGIDLLFAHVAEMLANLPVQASAISRRSTRVGLQVVNGEPAPQKGGCC
jgi:small GTP-binding protein